MTKKTEHNDPLMQLQQTWQQHKEHTHGLPFLTDEELGDIFTRGQKASPDPLPLFVSGSEQRTVQYARVRPFRYAAAICLALLMSGSVFAQSPSSTEPTRSDTISSQEAATAITHMLSSNGIGA